MNYTHRSSHMKNTEESAKTLLIFLRTHCKTYATPFHISYCLVLVPLSKESLPESDAEKMGWGQGLGWGSVCEYGSIPRGELESVTPRSEKPPSDAKSTPKAHNRHCHIHSNPLMRIWIIFSLCF